MADMAIASSADGGIIYQRADGSQYTSYPQASGYNSPTEQYGGSSTGSVLGATTGGGSSPISAPSPTSGGDGGGDNYNPVSAWEDQRRSEIGSSWDTYTGQLDQMLGTDLPGWQQSQQQTAQSSADLAREGVGTQRETSERAVGEQQTKSLKDLSSNLRNLFQAGNIYLGARGAGDSSAANMYSYGLTKLGSQARGDIQSQVSSRLNQIGDIYNTEVNRIESELNSRMGQISDWFNNAQMQLKQQKAQAGLGRSQDLQGLSDNILNMAMSEMQSIQQERSNLRSALDSWAISNSENTQQLMSNMQSVQQMPGYQGLTGGQPIMSGSGGMHIPGGYGFSSDEERV